MEVNEHDTVSGVKEHLKSQEIISSEWSISAVHSADRMLLAHLPLSQQGVSQENAELSVEGVRRLLCVQASASAPPNEW